MKKFFLLLFFMAFVYFSNGQIGISGSYQINDRHDWFLLNRQGPGEYNLLENGPSIGIDYWFRLKEVRVEFLPELNIAQYKGTTELPGDPNTKATYFSLFFNTNLYFLDFLSDCDCPTWSKQNDWLSRGLFFQISPGVSMIRQISDHRNHSGPIYDTNWIVSLGAALGLDIGISDMITISPKAGLRYHPAVNYPGLNSLGFDNEEWSVKSEVSSLLQFTAGLRLGIRLDYR